MANSYEPPNWAGKPPTGLHLDVLKEDKLIQKLMIDEKKFYLFGRNIQMNDFCIDHASCSRVHAAFIYHKHLNIAYLVDLGSTHGTYIGSVRLEAHKPTQLQINSKFHFGASTRNYILRERPSASLRNNIMEDIPLNESNEGALLGLPETQNEIDNLTEYNTAHNRRISMLGITDDNIRKQNQLKNPRKRRNVVFNDEEIIINPEDVDPNVGRFRNLIQTTVVPAKRLKFDHGLATTSTTITHTNISDGKHLHPSVMMASLYQDLPAAVSEHQTGKLSTSSVEVDVTTIAMGTKLGLLLPNPAPDVAPEPTTPEIPNTSYPSGSKGARFEDQPAVVECSNEPQKKKYAKEAWPGRKPLLGGL